METIVRWLIVGLVIYLAVGAGLYFFQRMFLYFPRSYVSVPHLDEISISSGDVTLHGYLANAGHEHLLLYFGGNAEQVASGIADISRHLPETTVVGFDYRGYGKSQGKPSEEALYRDAIAQYDEFADHYEKVSVLGRSLGSGVATYLASRRDIYRLVLVTPIDSVARIAADRFWFYPIDYLIKDRFDSVARAEEITVPVLMLTAAEDTLVPKRHLLRLKESFAADVVYLKQLDKVGHNTIQNSAEFAPTIQAFLQAEE